MTYVLGIDLGTTYTAAATARHGRAEVAALGYRATSVPTVVFVTDDGRFLVGDAAERRAAHEPDRVARGFKRRVGDPTPLLLGGAPIAVDRCLAEVLRVGDAFIACWDAKYRYNLLRPVTYIQAVVDPDWTPLLVTPPFPEHTSGHSVQSGAAFQVLTDLFGRRYRFEDHTHDDRGLAPRRFGSFRAAADEAALSRLYGGIHFRPAIELGLEQGRCVGRAVSELPFEQRCRR